MYCTYTTDALKGFFRINEDSLDESYEILKNNVNYYDFNSILEFKNGKSGSCIKYSDFNRLRDYNPLIKLLTTERRVEYTLINQQGS